MAKARLLKGGLVNVARQYEGVTFVVTMKEEEELVRAGAAAHKV